MATFRRAFAASPAALGLWALPAADTANRTTSPTSIGCRMAISWSRRGGPPLLLLLLPRSRDVELPLLAADLRRGLARELVAVHLQLVLDGYLHVLQLALGRERQLAGLERHVLELRLLLVLEGHGAGELVPVLLDDEGGLPLLTADVVLALPRPDRVRLVVPGAQGAAEPEHQHRREDRFHGCPRDRAGGKWSDADRPRPLTPIVRTTSRSALRSESRPGRRRWSTSPDTPDRSSSPSLAAASAWSAWRRELW